MSAEPTVLPVVSPPLPSPARALRIAYVDFQDVAEHREFRFRVHGLEGVTERRLRIAVAAFAGRVRLQDGPDVCYRKLLQTLAAEMTAADTTSLETITVDEADLARYADEHTKAPKHRSWSSTSPAAPRDPAAPSAAERPASPVVPAPVLQGGQRVRHSVYGLGVMSAPSGDHTAIHFDVDGPKRFVTAMLDVEVLSPPRAWETGPRGKNRLCA